MLKRSVRTICAVLLMAGAAIAVTPPSAGAFNFFVHGNIQCQVHGNTRYAPFLKNGAGQTTRFIMKGTLDSCTDGHGNTGGETGVPGMTILHGQFKVLSNVFGGDCANIGAPDMLMTIKWFSNNGVKVRDSNVGWLAPLAIGTEPYSYLYAGGTVKNFGLNGSYLGASGAASFIGDQGQGAAELCAPRLKVPWTFGADGQSMLSFLSPPTVTDATPNSSTLGATNLNVAINGMDFTTDDTVAFSGAGITVNSTTFVSQNEVDANISIDADALAGMRDITITNSTLGTGTCTSCFMVAPIVTDIAPGTVAQGSAGRDITINGLGFANGAVVSVSGPGVVVNYTQFVSPTQVVANVDTAASAPLGVRDVTVTDPGNGVGTCTGCLTVAAGPTVTSTSPVSRGGGAVNQVVGINGTNFAPGAVASFSGAGITVTNTAYVSPIRVNATISIAGGSAIGTRAVSVTNTDGGVGSCAACFTVNKTPNVTDWQISSGNYTVKQRHHHGEITLTTRQVMHADVVVIGYELRARCGRDVLDRRRRRELHDLRLLDEDQDEHRRRRARLLPQRSPGRPGGHRHQPRRRVVHLPGRSGPARLIAATT